MLFLQSVGGWIGRYINDSLLMVCFHPLYFYLLPYLRKEMMLSDDLTLGVVDIVLELESPRLVSLVRATATESSVLVVVESSAVQRAVSTVRLVVLV
jgi:hypothetical protein